MNTHYELRKKRFFDFIFYSINATKMLIHLFRLFLTIFLYFEFTALLYTIQYTEAMRKLSLCFKTKFSLIYTKRQNARILSICFVYFSETLKVDVIGCVAFFFLCIFTKDLRMNYIKITSRNS